MSVRADIKVSDSRKFSTIMGNLANFIDTVRLEFSRVDGLCVSSINKAHTMFVKVQILPVAFDGIEQLDEPFAVTVDTDFLSKVLGRVKGDLTLSIEDNRIRIFNRNNDEGNVRIFQVPLISEEYEPANPPRIDYSCKYRMDYGFLKEVIGDVKITSTDRLAFNVDSDEGIVSFAGRVETNEKSEAHCKPEFLKSDNDDGFRTVLSLELLDAAMKFDLGETLTVDCSENAPMLFSFRDDQGFYNASVMIAPRMEGD